MDTTLLSIILAVSMILMLAVGVWVSLTLVASVFLACYWPATTKSDCSLPRPAGAPAPAGH